MKLCAFRKDLKEAKLKAMPISGGKTVTVREKTAYGSTEDGGPLTFLRNS